MSLDRVQAETGISRASLYRYLKDPDAAKVELPEKCDSQPENPLSFSATEWKGNKNPVWLLVYYIINMGATFATALLFKLPSHILNQFQNHLIRLPQKKPLKILKTRSCLTANPLRRKTAWDAEWRFKWTLRRNSDRDSEDLFLGDFPKYINVKFSPYGDIMHVCY
jgi:hypothetical protein